MLTTLPFSGFYDSLHSSEVDNAEEQMFSDESGDANAGLNEALFNICDYQKVYEAYARDYAESFAHEFKLKSLRFDELNSPREYNFTTDRIFANISRADVRWLRANTTPLGLAREAEEQLTSRDGFSSFYNPNVATWGPLDQWDHNLVGVLLRAHVDETVNNSDGFDSYEELNLMEGARSNGYIEEWISDASPGIERLYNILEYLQKRAERPRARG